MRAPKDFTTKRQPAWRVSEVANVAAGLVPVGLCLAASSLCHSSRRHEGLSPCSDDYQPGRHGSTETSHRGGPARTSLLLAASRPSPAQKKVSGTLKRSKLPHLLRLESSRHLFLGPAKDNKQNDVRLQAKWLAQLAKMVCATRQNDVRSWQNRVRAISDVTDVLGKMMCALMCALVCALMCAPVAGVPVAQRISFHSAEVYVADRR